ncbi:MAG: septal ring lytic transglycosylase RlpA family lipoprotein [Comamonadaceae bacterium PBBC2]|nr:MAG: septal ring lytic transglycosylase RlpA family lipoprotein [Comamonadaceae bacterium PBBC2]
MKALVLFLALCGGACAAASTPRAHAADAQVVSESSAEASEASDAPLAQGWATWYGGKRWHGRRTASGERFDRQALTAAHLTLPMGTRVRVVNLSNGREVWVRINDRGPKGGQFIIDLSEAAAERLGMRRAGRARVALHVGDASHTPLPP